MTDSLPSDYATLSRFEKLDLLWSRVRADPYSSDALPTRVPGAWGRRKLFSVDYNRRSFEHAADELPEGRDKLVHRWGTVARVRVEVTHEHPYTGVVASGGEGLLRMSDATGGARFTPSLALKIPIDGKPSLNYFGLPAAARDPKDRDFLSGAFANSTPVPMAFDAKLLGRAFQKTAEALKATRVYAVYLPLHHFAGANLDAPASRSPSCPIASSCTRRPRHAPPSTRPPSGASRSRRYRPACASSICASASRSTKRRCRWARS